MEEKRKHKRLDLDVTVQLERLDRDDITTLKFVHVGIMNLSRGGIGFKAKQKLEVGTYYDTRLTIWTGEVIDAVIEIVRRDTIEEGYTYGAEFIGMTETDALKIDIYQIFNEL